MVDRLSKKEQEVLEAMPAPIPSLEERLLGQQKALLAMQDNLRLQLNGVANQLFLIDQLLNPKPVEAPETPSKPLSDPPGTI